MPNQLKSGILHSLSGDLLIFLSCKVDFLPESGIMKDVSQLLKRAPLRIRKFNTVDSVRLFCYFFFQRKIHLQERTPQRLVTIQQTSVRKVARMTQTISRDKQSSLLSLMKTRNHFKLPITVEKSVILRSFQKVTI